MGIYMSESEKGGMFCKKVVEVNVAQMGVDCSWLQLWLLVGVMWRIYWEAYIGLCCNGADMCLFMTDEIDDTDDNGDTDDMVDENGDGWWLDWRCMGDECGCVAWDLMHAILNDMYNDIGL